MNIITWHAVVFAAIFILMATGLVTLLFSRSTYTKTRAIPYAFVYGIGVVVWLASLFYAQYIANTYLTHCFSFSAGYVVTLGMLGLALTFPNNPPNRVARLLLAIDGLAGSVFIGLIFLTPYVLTLDNFATPAAPFSVPGKIFLLLVAVNFVSAVTVFIRRYLTEVRNRLYFNYIVLAFIALVVIGATTNLILPLSGVVSFAMVGPLAALLPFVAVVYALGISDINDISYVLAQLIKVGARLVIMAGLLVAGMLLNHLLGLGYYTASWVIAMSIVAGICAIGFYLFSSVLDKGVEDAIAFASLSPDTARTTMVMGLGGEIELEHNASFVQKFIKQILGVRAVGIVLLAKDGIFRSAGDLHLSQTELAEILKAVAGLPRRRTAGRALVHTVWLPNGLRDELEKRGIIAVKPIHTESGITGLYLLGAKFSQDVFTRQDAMLMHAITEISDLSIERALFYDEIQGFNATLQQRVDDATVRLRKANRRLKTLDSLKDDFISMASHQLRSPATAVRDAIKMLEQDYLTPQERERILSLADASSERLVTVVTDMLSVARIQAGHFTLEKTEVDMVELVERAILQASALAKEKGITIKFERPAKPLTLSADRAKLNEVMANYIENAIRYGEEHTGITVALQSAGGQVHFTVSDQGIGVPLDEQKDLFTKFYRARNARREHPNGNGIGLFVVKTVAEAHGGEAYYRPLERGSLFGFWLPT